MLSEHRSTNSVLAALGSDNVGLSEERCIKCDIPWPCVVVGELQRTFVRESNECVSDLLRPQWITGGLPQSSRAIPVVPGNHPSRVRCPYPDCGADVTEGIHEWRQAVNAVFAFKQTVELRVAARRSSDLRPPDDGETLWAERLFLSNTSTEFNRLLFSHHSHISFVVRERDSGMINPRIFI